MEDFAYMSERVVKFQSKEAVIMSTMETMKGTAHGILDTESKLNTTLDTVANDLAAKIDSALRELERLNSKAAHSKPAPPRTSSLQRPVIPPLVTKANAK
jgi:hypothetical protein